MQCRAGLCYRDPESPFRARKESGHSCPDGRFARLGLGVFFPNWKFMEALMESSGSWQHSNTLWEGPLVRQRTLQGTKHRN